MVTLIYTVYVLYMYQGWNYWHSWFEQNTLDLTKAESHFDTNKLDFINICCISCHTSVQYLYFKVYTGVVLNWKLSSGLPPLYFPALSVPSVIPHILRLQYVGLFTVLRQAAELSLETPLLLIKALQSVGIYSQSHGALIQCLTLDTCGIISPH